MVLPLRLSTGKSRVDDLMQFKLCTMVWEEAGKTRFHNSKKDLPKPLIDQILLIVGFIAFAHRWRTEEKIRRIFEEKCFLTRRRRWNLAEDPLYGVKFLKNNSCNPLAILLLFSGKSVWKRA